MEGLFLPQSRSNISQHTMLYSIRHTVSISPIADDRNVLGQKDSCHDHQQHHYHLTAIETEIIGFHFTCVWLSVSEKKRLFSDFGVSLVCH